MLFALPVTQPAWVCGLVKLSALFGNEVIILTQGYICVTPSQRLKGDAQEAGGTSFSFRDHYKSVAMLKNLQSLQ